MNSYELSAGELAADELTVFGRFRARFDLRGSTVVEVGGRLRPEAVADAGVAAWWSVDPRNPAAPEEGVVHTVRGPASAIPLPGQSAHFVFSCNAFQHVHDLDESLTELARVLRPGGYLYANFGPIWSGPDGSHIEALDVAGQRYDFWTHALLPSWSHLVFDETELKTLLGAAHPAGLAAAVSDYVFHSNWITRRTLGDYVRVLRQSPFEVVLLGGNAVFDYEYRPPVIDHPLAERLHPARLRSCLRELYRLDETEMQIRDLELVLRRR